MKLAEALIQRAGYQKRFEELKQRILRNAKIQEGEQPAEDPAELLAEANTISQQLVKLIQQINATNAAARFDETRTISDAIAERDGLRQRHALLSQFASAATVTQERYSRSEVKFKSTVSVSVIQKEADQLALAYRQLDAQLQAANWQLDLQE